MTHGHLFFEEVNYGLVDFGAALEEEAGGVFAGFAELFIAGID